jgi:hypothetical protein
LGRIITANIPSDAPKGKIGISLLGQAWMLLDSTFYEPRGIVGASLAKQLSTLLPAGWEVDFNLVSDTDKKTAIVQGVRKLRAQSANVVKFAGQPKTGYCNVKWTILGVPAHNEHKKQFAADSVLKTIDSDSPIGLAEGFETARALLKDVRGCLHEPTDFDKFLALPTDGGAPYRELLEKEIAAGLNRAFKEVTAENATVVASSPLARYIESGWAEEWVRRNPWNRG